MFLFYRFDRRRPPRLEHIGIAGDHRGLEKGRFFIGTEYEQIGHTSVDILDDI